MEITNKDLNEILTYANYSDDVFKTTANLDDGTIYLDATLNDDFTFICELYIVDEKVYLNTEQVRVLIDRLEDFKNDPLSFEDNEEPLTLQEWEKELECMNKIY